MESEVVIKAKAAQVASREIGIASTEQKNKALICIAELLEKNTEDIIAANMQDIEHARTHGMSEAMLDRLRLTKSRIEDMAAGVRQVVDLQDPVHISLKEICRPNGLKITKVTVPLGVVAMIYESRPNVTVDAAALCIKSGNACVLRGGSESIHSNTVLVRILKQGLQQAGLNPDSAALLENTDRALVQELLTLRQYIDVAIPRGGAGLIQMVVRTAKVPVIETGSGVCHVYVDKQADLDMAVRIVENVEMRGDILAQKAGTGVKAADDTDWGQEYNALIMSIKTVASIDEAMEHIRRYGTKHSEAIVTEDTAAAERFLQEVDAAAVYVNASTRYTDGFEFGFGAEIGISTQKLHVRGPMGLEALVSYKYIIHGQGQIRT